MPEGLAIVKQLRGHLRVLFYPMPYFPSSPEPEDPFDALWPTLRFLQGSAVVKYVSRDLVLVG